MDKYDEIIEWLLEEGALYYNGEVDEFGGEVMQMNGPLLKELCEPLYTWFIMETDAAVLELVDEGFAEMEWDDEQNDFVVTIKGPKE